MSSRINKDTVVPLQVKDWANGQAADIGELRVVPGSVGTGYATGSIGAAATAAAAATAESAAPFYQQLAQHAQYLEVGIALQMGHSLTCASVPQRRLLSVAQTWSQHCTRRHGVIATKSLTARLCLCISLQCTASVQRIELQHILPVQRIACNACTA